MSALVTVLVLTGLSWLGISALTNIDSREAHELRVAAGLEHVDAVCGTGSHLSECNYDDRTQEKVDREFFRRRGIRVAILSELEQRIEMAISQLDEADRLLQDMELDPRTGEMAGDTVALRAALSESIINVAPATMSSVEVRRARLLERLDEFEPAPKNAREVERRLGMFAKVNGKDVEVHQDPTPKGIGWIKADRRSNIQANSVHDDLVSAVSSERVELLAVRTRVRAMLQRDGVRGGERQLTNRVELIENIERGLGQGNDPNSELFAQRIEVATWLASKGHVDWLDGDAGLDVGAAMMHKPVATLISDSMYDVDLDLARVAHSDLETLHAMISDPSHELWASGWIDSLAARTTILKPMVRYRSPIGGGERWRLFGVVTFLLSGIMLMLVGPIVTATSTAREREAGTLPVLRMTGLSAGDLALAMAIGPNVFALVTGAGLLVLALPVLALTAGPSAMMVPVGLLLLLTAATHLTAIGLGDALGQRVNAMVVGGLLGVAVLGPGLVGAVMVVGDMAATGLLLGPLPALVGEAVGMSGLPYANLLEHGHLSSSILGYTVAVQTLLGGLCLLSWRRRVEQAWAPLFRPIEGAALALASVGCSALAVFDLSQRLDVQTYDTVNLITFVSTAFLMPILGWLLVSSLVRPARASAMASVSEVRRAFLRFQLFVVLTGAALAAAYALVLDGTHLRAEKSEVMWATLTQGLLVAETAVATLLLASRRRKGRHRVFFVGTAVALLQLGFAVAVYNLEVEHVAFTQKAGLPFMVGMDASPYWMAFLLVAWAAGLGLVLAALLRERGREEQQPQEAASAADDEVEKGRRWLH
ncbi:MAG: hypothetical protein AAF799_26855 [Myxococcota bacterium]